MQRRDLGHYEDIDVNILDVSETREEEEHDEEEDDEVEAEDEDFEDFISDEDEELAVGDMCLDDSEDEDDDPDSDDDKGLAKGGRRLIRLVNSRPTPLNNTPSASASASPTPTPHTTSNPNRTYPLCNSHGSPFSSPRIQTSVFNSEESPQLNVDACRSISSAIQLENLPNLDSSTEVNSTRRGKTQIWPDGKGETLKDTFKEVRKKPDTRPQWLDEAIWKELWAYWNSNTFKKKSDAAKLNRASTTGEKYVEKLSETQATQSTQATFDGSTPSTPSEPSYDEQMKIWIDANGLTKRGCLCGFGPEGDIYTNSQGSCSIQNRGKAYTNTFATLVDENKRQKIELDSQKKVLDDVQEKLTLEQAKSKKQTKKVHKYAKATQDIQAQMFQWHSLMKTILPNLPPPMPVIDSLSESEDAGEDENDDDGGGGVDE
ncbi:hypothetical protein Cgig2_008292 [Carnegiea gigantea]|uniref:Uncharacterized protein n=1 Tax=Carnegiea gigantea TaxID=171969 RepID=A0A9Q1JNA3_9CARY|nr:hypothetical protein Cgig2_008292 [Carnegiea gigantea]